MLARLWRVGRLFLIFPSNNIQLPRLLDRLEAATDVEFPVDVIQVLFLLNQRFANDIWNTILEHIAVFTAENPVNTGHFPQLIGN